MNITLQTNNFENQAYKYNTTPAFKGVVPTRSKYFEPWNKFKDVSTDFIAKHYTKRLYESPIAKFLAKHTEKLRSVVDHMQVMGSIIISGMYMSQTLRNKNLDEKKRKTLAINQGLTFLVSTALSYLIDKRLDNKWEKFTRKYAAESLGIDIQTLNKNIDEWNVNNKKKFDLKVLTGEIGKDEKFRPGLVADYAEKTLDRSLTKELKGMGVLKKLLVFGTIYRFLSPVAVTPIANWIGNKFIYKEDQDKSSEAKSEAPALADKK